MFFVLCLLEKTSRYKAAFFWDEDREQTLLLYNLKKQRQQMFILCFGKKKHD